MYYFIHLHLGYNVINVSLPLIIFIDSGLLDFRETTTS